MAAMKKLLLSGIAALFRATGTAHAGSLYSEEWAANCRWMIIEKLRPIAPGEDKAPESVMFITKEDLPALERAIKDFKGCIAFWKCVEDRDAGKTKHCYEKDKRWPTLFKATNVKESLDCLLEEGFKRDSEDTYQCGVDPNRLTAIEKRCIQAAFNVAEPADERRDDIHNSKKMHAAYDRCLVRARR
jgi:hypothetical protein